MKLLQKGDVWCSDSVIKVLSIGGEKNFKPHRESSNKTWGKKLGQIQPKEPKKYILARRVINHRNKLPRMVTDFFLSWGLLIDGGSSLENTLEPKANYRGHYHCKWMQSFGLCKGGGQLWPPDLWTCESYSPFAFWRAPALLTQAALRDLINDLLTTAERRCSRILAVMQVLTGEQPSASDLSPLPPMGVFYSE